MRVSAKSLLDEFQNYKMHKHNCEWHFEQYPWECTCGLTELEQRYKKYKTPNQPE